MLRGLAYPGLRPPLSRGDALHTTTYYLFYGIQRYAAAVPS